MDQKSVYTVLITVALLGVHFTAGAQNDPGANIKTLTLGAVFQEPREPVEEHFRPFVNYVARKLSPSGETKGAVIVAGNAAQMTKLLNEQRVDFYMESPYPTYLINHLGAAKLLLRRWKGGMAEYHSIIFAAKDGGTARLDDLRGKMIAFEDPGSTSGYFLPKLFLLKKGFAVVEKPNSGAKVSAGEIGYTFTGSDKNVVSLVVQKKVAAGAISNDDHARLDARNKAAMAILGESEPVPRHLVSVRKDLPEPLVKRLKEILVTMHQEEEGRKILSQTGDTTKFDSLPGGEESMRRKLVELYRPRGKQ